VFAVLEYFRDIAAREEGTSWKWHKPYTLLLLKIMMTFLHLSHDFNQHKPQKASILTL
jgi:hypothetical protein